MNNSKRIRQKTLFSKKEIVDKFNWEAGGKIQNEEKLNNELKITGWNMMKAHSLINF